MDETAEPNPADCRGDLAASAGLRDEDLYRLVVEAATDYAILTTDAEARIATWSPGAEAVFGWAHHEVLGLPIAELFIPEDRAAGEPEREFAAARDAGFAPDVRWHRRKDGARVFIDGSTQALRRPDGAFLGVLKIGQDVTERVLANDRIRASEARFRAVWDAATDALALSDPEGIVLAANPAYLDLYGYAEDEVVGRPFSVIFPEQHRAAADEQYHAVFADPAEPRSYVARVRRRDGAECDVEARASFVVENGRRAAMVSAVRDVTDRVAADAALRASEERFRSFAENSADTLWILDAAVRRLEYLSPAFEPTWGESREAVLRDLGRWREMVHPNDRERAGAALSSALAGESVVAEYRIVRPSDGAVRWIRDTGFPIRDDAGAVRRVAGIARDVTDQRRAEAERAAFVDAAAHDLRTPLTAIRGQAQLMRRRLRAGRTEDPTMLEGGLAGIEAAANRMAALIDEMMDAAHLAAGRDLELRPALVDLVALVDEAAAEARAGYPGRAIRVETVIPALSGAWDGARLARVLANLLSNALKYSPAGSPVAVRIDREEGDDGRAWAVLAVRDEGVGIPATDLPRLFQRFHRGANVAGRTTGTGIGLAGVRRIVEQHGGAIRVESAEGRGSTFTVLLPAP